MRHPGYDITRLLPQHGIPIPARPKAVGRPNVGWAEKPSMMPDENAGLVSPAYFNLTAPEILDGRQWKRSCFPYFDHCNASVAANNHRSQIMRGQTDCRHRSSVLWWACRDRGSQPPNSQGDFRPGADTPTRFRRAHKPKASCAKGASQPPNAKRWCMTLRLCTLYVCALRPLPAHA